MTWKGKSDIVVASKSGFIQGKEQIKMKYCPYCGAILLEGVVSFCSECGKALPTAPEKQQEGAAVGEKQTKEKDGKEKNAKSRKKRAPKHRRKKKEEIKENSDDGYDGYYDDVRPEDEDGQKEGLDKELVKKVVLLAVSVLAIVGACVVLMYLL